MLRLKKRRFTMPMMRRISRTSSDTYSHETLSPEFFNQELAKYVVPAAEPSVAAGPVVVDKVSVVESRHGLATSSSLFSLPIVLGYQLSRERAALQVEAGGGKSRSVDSKLYASRSATQQVGFVLLCC